MAILNITYQGHSTDYELELDYAADDADIRRIAVEVARLPEHAFDHFVIDRLRAPDGVQRIYLRPKVPFGARPRAPRRPRARE
jgi:hypothetical protein